jgi:PBP1b-binding outer membrane lipoprotein LpoB
MNRIILFMAIIAVLLMSCGQSKEFKKNEEKALVQDVGIASADSVALPNQNDKIEETKNKEPNKPKVPENIDWDKKIIKTADVALQVKDYTVFNNTIHSKVKSYGAYIASEEQTQNDGGVQNSISIKQYTANA